jgi:hypothetical protein
MNPAFDSWVERARNVPIEREIERRGIKLNGNKIERCGPCPLCGGDDRFSINTAKQVFNCRGCGIGGDVIKLVEHLDGSDFITACSSLAGEPPPPKAKKANGKDNASKIVVAEFPYHDENGNIVFVVDRIEHQNPNGSFVLKDGKHQKTFRQRRPDPDHPDRWLPNKHGTPVVLYRLPQTLEAIAAGYPVFIVEGEAKADLLWSWNVAATCCAQGAGKWKPEHSEFLRGADVVLVPDNDGVGWEHIHAVGASLAGVAKRTRVLVLPCARAKDDVIDWTGAGGTREQLDALLAEARDWKPPTVEETNERLNKKKDQAKKHEDELLDQLSKLKGLEFARERKKAADELDVSVTAIDAELNERRSAAPLYGHWLVEPWPEPADGDSLLRDIIRRVRQHVVCSHDDALVIALWIIFSWVHEEVAIHSPLLLITSAEPESGKTTTLNLMSYLAPRAVASVEISKAALYRAIQLWQPSFIIDEFDTVLSSTGDNDKAELRSVINSGHVRGQGVIRCITDEHRPEVFSTFAPKALGMIGRKLPAATLSRCIIVELRRRTKGETVERFAHKDDPELGDLRRRLRRWAMYNADNLQVEVSMPPTFDNRRADNWRVLLAIADLCSGAEDWGDKARVAATKVEGASDTSSIGVILLIHIKRIFDEDKCEYILSGRLVDRLKEDPEAPWAEWNRGRGLSQKGLAELLGGRRGGFGIRSVDIRLPDGGHGQGYRLAQFEEAWARYCPLEG